VTVPVAVLSLGLLGAAPPRPSPTDPFAAYETRKFEDSLKGFLDLEVEHPNDPRVQQNLGSAYYKLGRYEDAERRFASGQQLTADAKRRAQLEYDAGNTAYRRGQMDQAAGHYEKALELTPSDADAKYNLELVRREIKKREEQNKQEQKERREKKDQGQTQQQKNARPDDKKEQAKQAAGDGDKKNAGDQSQAQAEPGQKGDKLSRQEAERYLRNINEERPKDKQKGRSRQPDKDW